MHVYRDRSTGDLFIARSIEDAWRVFFQMLGEDDSPLARREFGCVWELVRDNEPVTIRVNRRGRPAACFDEGTIVTRSCAEWAHALGRRWLVLADDWSN